MRISAIVAEATASKKVSTLECPQCGHVQFDERYVIVTCNNCGEENPRERWKVRNEPVAKKNQKVTCPKCGNTGYASQDWWAGISQCDTCKKTSSAVKWVSAKPTPVATRQVVSMFTCPLCGERNNLKTPMYVSDTTICRHCDSIVRPDGEPVDMTRLGKPGSPKPPTGAPKLNVADFKAKADEFLKLLQPELLAKVRGTLAAAQKAGKDVTTLKVNLVGIVTMTMNTWRSVLGDPAIVAEERVATLPDYHVRLLQLSLGYFDIFMDKKYKSGGKLHPLVVKIKERVKQKIDAVAKTRHTYNRFSDDLQKQMFTPAPSSVYWVRDFLENKPKLSAYLKRVEPRLYERLVQVYKMPTGDDAQSVARSDAAHVVARQVYAVLSKAVRTAK